MSTEIKFLLGVVLGYVGYCAYKKLKATQTVLVIDNLNHPAPNVIDVATLAGRRK